MSRHIRSYEDTDWGGEIGAFFGAILATSIMVFLMVMAMELVRLHRANNPFEQTEAGAKVRLAGLMLLLSIGLTIVLALFPSTQPAAPYPVSIGFLLWVLFLEWIDLHYSETPNPDDKSLEDTLGPWRFNTSKKQEVPDNEPVAANIFK
jgi:hypothetical protein